MRSPDSSLALRPPCPFLSHPHPLFQLLKITLCGCRMFSLLIPSLSHGYALCVCKCMYSVNILCMCECEPWYLGLCFLDMHCAYVGAFEQERQRQSRKHRRSKVPPRRWNLSSRFRTSCVCVCLCVGGWVGVGVRMRVCKLCAHSLICFYTLAKTHMLCLRMCVCVCVLHVCVMSGYLKLL